MGLKKRESPPFRHTTACLKNSSSTHHTHPAGMRVRVATTALVYRKVLSMSSKAVSETTTGKLVNLISNDTERFDQTTPFLHFLVIGPIKVLVVAYLVYLQLGYSGVIGVAVCTLLAPMQYAMGTMFAKIRQKTAQFTDRRIKYMNEVIAGIRLIKMYAWEVPYAATVAEVRSDEEKQVRITVTMRAVNAFFFFAGTPLIMFIIITIYIHVQDDPLEPSNVFASMMYFNALRFSISLFIPEAIKNGSECLISMQRLQGFLEAEDHIPDENRTELSDDIIIKAENVTSTWPGSHTSIFENLNLTVKKGELIGICGTVGAGKTSLFSLLTGELQKGSGVLEVTHAPTVASQEVWLTSDTVRNNILFGRELDEARYADICEVCGLYSDFEQFADSDHTMIGDRGITLSGGQKARIGLARACYEGGELFLLDDPLSAVDTVVGRKIITECIGGLLREKTRVLITHQHQFLPLCDRVFEISAETKCLVDMTEKFRTKSPSMSMTASPLRTSFRSNRTPPSSVRDEKKEKEERFEMVTKEDRMTGGVTWRTYIEYFQHGGSALAVFCVALMLLGQISFVLNDVWLTFWVDRSDDKKDNSYHYRYYAASMGILCVLAWVRAYFFYRMAINASTSMHNKMFRAVVRTSCMFFDSNPTGRILNRFSKDIGQMDELLPWIFFDCLMQSLICFGAIILISVFNPWLLLAVAPILGIFIFLRNYFVATGREVKRLEALNRSPLYSMFSETVNGVGTIRSYGRTEYFTQKYSAVQDDHTSAFYLFIACNRWIGFRLDIASWVFIAAVCIASVLSRNEVSTGQVALSITYAVILSGTAQWSIRQSAELENMMTATERVRLYGNLEPEGGPNDVKPELLTTAATRTATTWPARGEVEFKHFSMRYREGLPLVLKDVSFHVAAGMTVGVVGRTGAGKSSLMQAVFRLTEGCAGSITIDGRDTKDVSLHELRSGCAVIPQDPVLFTGSIRHNVDPFGNAESDKTIWNALRDVQLQQVVEELPLKLDFVVKEGGRNFSVGQRQLICLARAILRDNKILIMDEATANVDPETDLIVQETVRSQFRGCSVLIIAHRLHTVIDSDRILVLSGGEVAAYGDPHELLQEENSILANFVAQTGDDSAASLRDSARAASLRRSQHGAPF